MKRFNLARILIITLVATMLLAGLSGIFVSAVTANDSVGENDNYTNGNDNDNENENESSSPEGLDPDEAQSSTIDDGFNLLGIFEFIFGHVFHFMYNLAGHNYLLTLILFTLVLSVLLIPFDIKQRQNMIKQAGFRPIELAISKKYKGRTDRESQTKKNQELMEARKERGVPMLGGCLPLLIQMPIFIALFAIVRTPLLYIARITEANLIYIQQAIVNHGFVNEGRNLSDQLQIVGYLRNYLNPASPYFCETLTQELSGVITYAEVPRVHMFGIDISVTPWDNLFPWLIFVPLLTFATSFLFSRINAKYNYRPMPTEGPGAGNMKMMEYMAPAMAVFFSFIMPAALGVYWMFRSLMQSAVTLVMARIKPLPTFTDEELKAAEKEYLGKTKDKNSRLPSNHGPREGQRSLHYIDADDDE